MHSCGCHLCISHFSVFHILCSFRSSSSSIWQMLTKRNVTSYEPHCLGGIQTWRIQNCRGQHRQIFHPHLQNGDPLLVVNICKYIWHSLYSWCSWYGEQPRNHSLIPSRSKEFSCQRVLTDLGAHQGYCLVDSWHLPLVLVWECVELIFSPPFAFMVWMGSTAHYDIINCTAKCTFLLYLHTPFVFSILDLYTATI